MVDQPFRLLRLIAFALLAGTLALSAGCASTTVAEAPAQKQPPYGRYSTDGVPPYRAPGAPPPETVPIAPAPALTPGEKTVVGLLLPLTGQHAAIGDAMLKAAQMAVFDLGGETFTLLPRDTRATPEGAAEAAREVVAQNGKLILGPLLSSSIVAAAEAARPAGVSLVAFSNNSQIAGNGVWLLGFLPEAEVRRVTRYAYDKGMRRFAALAPDTAYGRLVVAAFEDTVRRLGGTVVKTGWIPETATLADLPRHLQEVAGGGYDAVMLPFSGEKLNQVAALLPQQGIEPARVKLLGTGQWEQPSLFAEPTLIGGWLATVAPETRAGFIERYRSVYGVEPPRLATLAYDATALAAALAAGGRYDVPTLTAPRGYAGADGFFRLTPQGTAERGLAVLEVTPGGLRTIDPAPTRAEDLLL